MKHKIMISIIVLFALISSQDRSLIFDTGEPISQDGYLIYDNGTSSFSFADRFTVNYNYVLQTFSIYIELNSESGSVVAAIHSDGIDQPDEIIQEWAIQLSPSQPFGIPYTIHTSDECISLTSGENYWLTIKPGNTITEAVWLYGQASTYLVNFSYNLGDTWNPTFEYNFPGAAQILGDRIFETEFVGDINSDYLVDVLDIVMIVSHVIGALELTYDQIEESDITNDGLVDILDVVALVELIIVNDPVTLTDFALEDINDNSPTFEELVGPFFYQGDISCYYFGKAG